MRRAHRRSAGRERNDDADELRRITIGRTLGEGVRGAWLDHKHGRTNRVFATEGISCLSSFMSYHHGSGYRSEAADRAWKVS